MIRVHGSGCPLCGKPTAPGKPFCSSCAQKPIVRAGTRIAEGILSANEDRIDQAAGAGSPITPADLDDVHSDSWSEGWASGYRAGYRDAVRDDGVPCDDQDEVIPPKRLPLRVPEPPPRSE